MLIIEHSRASHHHKTPKRTANRQCASGSMLRVSKTQPGKSTTTCGPSHSWLIYALSGEHVNKSCRINTRVSCVRQYRYASGTRPHAQKQFSPHPSLLRHGSCQRARSPNCSRCPCPYLARNVQTSSPSTRHHQRGPTSPVTMHTTSAGDSRCQLLETPR